MERKNEAKGNMYDKIKRYLSFKVKLSPQEEAIAEIIQRVLKTPGTKKITPGEDAYYVLNYDAEYFIRVGCGTVAVFSSDGAIQRDVPPAVSDYMRGLILAAVQQDAVDIEEGLFNNEMRLLQHIQQRLPNYAETTPIDGKSEDLLH